MDLSVDRSMAAVGSSAPFFGMREEDHNQMIKQQQSASSPSSPTAPPAQSAAEPVKKRRNLPGTPNPDAEVIALSPRTLMATNRFVCEVCNKGFQREQNLQLHRRGHNLPWKLKQKNPNDVARRKVYLCPEPSCVHHEPSRALGDLTGIKKHFCRKHGEKKWKCDKCSKRYAVQSDWKAHAKTCGTREYRCECGTLFSRRDSFITHRAFCDALAQESARLPPSLASLGSHLYGSGMGLGLSQVSPQISSLHDQVHHPSAADLLRLGATGGSSQFDHLLSPSFRPPSSPFFLGTGGSNQDFVNGVDTQSTHHPLLQTKPFSTGLMQLPDLQSNAAANLFNLSFFSSGSGASDEQAATLFSTSLMNEHAGGGLSSLFGSSIHENHHDSVGLPQMSATALLQKAAQMGATTSGGGGGSSSSALLRGFRSSSSTLAAAKNEAHIHDLMNSLANGNAGFGGFNAGGLGGSMGGSDGMTRDFLGLGSMVRMSHREQHHHHGIDIGSMEPELKSTISGAQSFPGGSMQ